MKKLCGICIFVLMTITAFQSRAYMTYDLGGASGSDNGDSYAEIHLGLNWFMVDWLNWRNAIFTRFGTDLPSVNGLDSSLLATLALETSGHGFGVELFAGPGLRFATANNSGAFVEGGMVFNLAGLHIGAGARCIDYYNNRYDNLGDPLAKNETQFFVILSGGGVL